MEPITSFRGAHRWLSNFAAVEVVLDGETYPSVEHAYQAAKTFNRRDRASIRACRTAGAAKQAGRAIAPTVGWDTRRVAVMRDLVRQKFAQEPFRRWLGATQGAHLTEGNTWHDNFWGNCVCKACVLTPGQNRLGRVIMAVRAELRHAAR